MTNPDTKDDLPKGIGRTLSGTTYFGSMSEVLDVARAAETSQMTISAFIRKATLALAAQVNQESKP